MNGESVGFTQVIVLKNVAVVRVFELPIGRGVGECASTLSIACQEGGLQTKPRRHLRAFIQEELQEVGFAWDVSWEFRGVVQVRQHHKRGHIIAAPAVASRADGLAARSACAVFVLLFGHAVVIGQKKPTCQRDATEWNEFRHLHEIRQECFSRRYKSPTDELILIS